MRAPETFVFHGFFNLEGVSSPGKLVVARALQKRKSSHLIPRDIENRVDLIEDEIISYVFSATLVKNVSCRL